MKSRIGVTEITNSEAILYLELHNIENASSWSKSQCSATRYTGESVPSKFAHSGLHWELEVGNVLQVAPIRIYLRATNWRRPMSCKSCHSDKQTLFPSELCIHFPNGFKALDKEPVMVFPRLLACLNCGFTECSLPEAELRRLAQVLGSSERGRDKSGRSSDKEH